MINLNTYLSLIFNYIKFTNGIKLKRKIENLSSINKLIIQSYINIVNHNNKIKICSEKNKMIVHRANVESFSAII